MKHTKKLFATAILTAMLVGCKTSEASALPDDYDATLGDVIMEKVYDETLTSIGYSAMFDELVKQIIIAEKIEERRADELYERINDEIVTLIQKDSSFIDDNKYAKNNPVTQYYADGEPREYGIFDDNAAAIKLRADGYKLTCDGNIDITTCDIWDAKAILTEDGVVNTYVEKVIKPKVLKTMLDEEYIVQKRKSYFGSTLFRKVETVYVDFDSRHEEESTTLLYDFQNRVMNGTMTLEDVETEWQDFKVRNVQAEIAEAEANTDKKEEMLNKYVCSDEWEVCKNKALKEADEAEYYEEAEIHTNTSTVVNSNITSRIFSSSVINNDSNRALYLFEDPTNPAGTVENPTPTSDKWFFMRQYVDEPLPIDSIINRESGKNYFIRVNFLSVNEALATSTDAADQELKYEIARVLAEKSSNLSGNILYFLNSYDITIHDQEFLDYVKAQYDYPEDSD